MRLYEIAQVYKALQEQLDSVETPDEMRQVLIDTMESLGMDFEDKAENMAALIAENNAMVDACEKEISRLSDKVTRLKAQNTSIKNYLKMEMQIIGKRKVTAGIWQISIAKNGGKIPIEWNTLNLDISSLPERFIKREENLNIVAVREALEAGEELSFAKLGERGESLRIK